MNLLAIAKISYIVGLIWRTYYVLIVHVPTAFLYSDMKGYEVRALLALDPEYTGSIADTVYPPGMHLFLALTYLIAGDWTLFLLLQWLGVCLLPLMIAWLGKEIFSPRVGHISLITASLYFPLFDYGGYFLAEASFILLTYGFACAAWCSYRERSVLCTAIAGILYGLLGVFKSIGLFTMLPLVVLLLLKSRRVTIVVTFLLALGTVLVPSSYRCTRLNEGAFCLIDNNAGGNVLQGHAGNDVRGGIWHDAVRGIHFEFTFPTYANLGRFRMLELPFGYYESSKNIALAYQWCSDNPGTCLQESLISAYNNLRPLGAWPTADMWPALAKGFMWVFLVLLFVPSLLLLLTTKCTANRKWCLVMLSPFVMLMVASMLTMGSTRYRVPLDGFFILMSSQFYDVALRWFTKFSGKQDNPEPDQNPGENC